MKKTVSVSILALWTVFSSCGHGRFKTYRATSVNVFDKKIDEEQAQFYRILQASKDAYDLAVKKAALGEKSTPAEQYDSMGYVISVNNGELRFRPADILLPSEMNPRWIEVAPDYIIFKDREKKEVNRFKIKSIDTQEGIKDANWLIKIDDKEIEEAILSDGVLQLKCSRSNQFDYTYTFAGE